MVADEKMFHSKINYLDPRITSAWCKDNDVPIEKLFSKTLLIKCTWAGIRPRCSHADSIIQSRGHLRWMPTGSSDYLILHCHELRTLDQAIIGICTIAETRSHESSTPFTTYTPSVHNQPHSDIVSSQPCICLFLHIYCYTSVYGDSSVIAAHAHVIVSVCERGKEQVMRCCAATQVYDVHLHPHTFKCPCQSRH
jgi:hypothetical protein